MSKTIKTWDLSKFFKDKEKYKYVGKLNIHTPNGILTPKVKWSATGKEWKNILVFDLSENTMPALNDLFIKTK